MAASISLLSRPGQTSIISGGQNKQVFTTDLTKSVAMLLQQGMDWVAPVLMQRFGKGQDGMPVATQVLMQVQCNQQVTDAVVGEIESPRRAVFHMSNSQNEK